MAGDWIKVEKDTPTKPEMLALASCLNVTVEKAFFLCFRFWSWADSNCLDGVIRNVPLSAIDSALGLADGFANALLKCGWLAQRDNTLTIPRFSRHLGQSAKKRATSAERQSRQRSRNERDGERDENVTPSSLLSSTLAIPPPEGNEGAGERGPPRGLSLGALWVFFLARTKARGKADDPDDAQSLFDELKRVYGISDTAIEAEISRPGRDRGEHLWEFRKRLLPKDNGKPKSKREELRERARSANDPK